jgi:hypothetical protein
MDDVILKYLAWLGLGLGLLSVCLACFGIGLAMGLAL